jgi:hypothetical protein
MIISKHPEPYFGINTTVLSQTEPLVRAKCPFSCRQRFIWKKNDHFYSIRALFWNKHLSFITNRASGESKNVHFHITIVLAEHENAHFCLSGSSAKA